MSQIVRNVAIYNFWVRHRHRRKNLAGKSCSDCGTLFWDDNGNEMVEIENTINNSLVISG